MKSRRQYLYERYPYRATVQERHGRRDHFFETVEEFEAFMEQEQRYCTSYSVPEDYTRIWTGE